MRMVHGRVMVALDHICCDIGRGSCEPSHRCLLDHLPNSHVVLTHHQQRRPRYSRDARNEFASV